MTTLERSKIIELLRANRNRANRQAKRAKFVHIRERNKGAVRAYTAALRLLGVV